MDLSKGGLADSPRPATALPTRSKSSSDRSTTATQSSSSSSKKGHKRQTEPSESATGRVESSKKKHKHKPTTTAAVEPGVTQDELAPPPPPPPSRFRPETPVPFTTRSTLDGGREDGTMLPPPLRPAASSASHSRSTGTGISGRFRASSSSSSSTTAQLDENDDDDNDASFTSYHSPVPTRRTSSFFAPHDRDDDEDNHRASSPGFAAARRGETKDGSGRGGDYEANEGARFGYVSASAWCQEMGLGSFGSSEGNPFEREARGEGDDPFIEARPDSCYFSSRQLAANDDGADAARTGYELEPDVIEPADDDTPPTLDSNQQVRGHHLSPPIETGTRVVANEPPARGIDLLDPIPSLFPGPNPFLEHAKALVRASEQSSSREEEEGDDSRGRGGGAAEVKAQDVVESVKTGTADFTTRFTALLDKTQALFERSCARQVALGAKLDEHSDRLAKEDELIATTKERLDSWTGQLFNGGGGNPAAPAAEEKV